LRLVDLSHTLADGMAVFPGDASPRLVRTQTHGTDGAMVTVLELGAHCGTHVDVPLHFRAGEPGLEALPLARFHGPARVVTADVSAAPAEIPLAVLEGVDLAGLDFLLLRTGWERHWGTPRYHDGWPSLAPGLVRALCASGLKGVGLDTPGADPLHGRLAHDLFAAAAMINIENLAHLDELPDSTFELLVLPLKLSGTEASPVRAVALLP
jgi:arylformamidase